MTETVTSPEGNDSEIPTLDMIRSLAMFDPHHLVEAMQKALPFTEIPGVDIARLTETQEKNLAVLQGAARMEQQVFSKAAETEFRLMQEQISETLNAIREISGSGNPVDASARQTELAVKTLDRLSQETEKFMEEEGSRQMDIFKMLAKRYVDALGEIKQMTSTAERLRSY